MMIWCKIIIATWVRLEVSRPLWKKAASWSGQYLAGFPIHWQLFIYRLGENRLHVHILIAFQWSDMLYLSWKQELNHAVNRVIQLILIMSMLLPQHMNSCYSENELGLDCDAFQSWEIFLTFYANIWHLQNNRWISQNMRRLLASFDRGNQAFNSLTKWARFTCFITPGTLYWHLSDLQWLLL